MNPYPSDFNPTKPWTGYVPLGHVCANPNQPRQTFRQEPLLALAASLKISQEQPCSVVPCTLAGYPEVQWMLVDGERRWQAAAIAQLPQIWVTYQPGVTADNIHRRSLTANFCREGHGKVETARAFAYEMAKGTTTEQIATSIGRSESMVLQHLSLLNLHPDLLPLLDSNDRATKMPMQTGVLLSKHTTANQLKLWNKVKSSPSSVQIHKVRTSSVDAAGYSEGNNARRIEGMVRRALNLLAGVNELGTQMLRSLTPQKAATLRKQVIDIRIQAMAFEKKLDLRMESESAGEGEDQ